MLRACDLPQGVMQNNGMAPLEIRSALETRLPCTPAERMSSRCAPCTVLVQISLSCLLVATETMGGPLVVFRADKKESMVSEISEMRKELWETHCPSFQSYCACSYLPASLYQAVLIKRSLSLEDVSGQSPSGKAKALGIF